ncbi:hypothetical protein M1P97_23065 [Parabacteroides sp. GYB001]|uniref:hypothetical protein n=1 Tax=Parabacteroides leei TaxID=2939491 RepID=UPI002017F912|nr:hypothetical protein [Parabacteroides leei]MCL3854171.1 hypothetical protein [Parabacteroides leei]
MSTKLKEIQTSTLESRFKKLHDAANFAEESCKAIAFHINDLQPDSLSAEQSAVIENLRLDIENWCKKFVRLASQVQDIEAEYWNHLSDDKTKCTLIEEVPTYSKTEIPNIFQMTEKLFEIGYYSIDGAIQNNRTFSDYTIISNIKDLRMNIILCIKALANANYKGIWKPIENTIFDIYEFQPGNNIDRLVSSFDI